MGRRIALAAAAALAGTMLWSPAASAADAERGRSLYEERCTECHSESVHGRAKRVARDFDEVRGWVARWNATLALHWSDADVDDVAAHLNARYYRYPCPATICTTVSLAGTRK